MLSTLKLFKGCGWKSFFMGVVLPVIFLVVFLCNFAGAEELPGKQICMEESDIIEMAIIVKELDKCEEIIEKENILISKYKEEVTMYTNHLEQCYNEVNDREITIEKTTQVFKEKEKHLEEMIDQAKPSIQDKFTWASFGGVLVLLLMLL